MGRLVRILHRRAVDNRARARASGVGACAARAGHAARPRARRVRHARRARQGRVSRRQPVRGRAVAAVRGRVRCAAVAHLPDAARAQPVAVRLCDQPGRRRVPRWRLARDVRPRRVGRRWAARRDMPNLWHNPAWRRRARGRAKHPEDLVGPKGGVGAYHVHRRRPQRQIAHLRARLRPRDWPSANRDVLAAYPHRRSRRGLPAAGLRRARRVPLPHVGGNGYRRAKDLGDAFRRAA
mmetsp:Transcript_4094/g.12717  ORF Transcript_4094/g.12717 Transcript_4094/m.12717 type:complete len:237 (-) Transcript_4094:260-970(-)